MNPFLSVLLLRSSDCTTIIIYDRRHTGFSETLNLDFRNELCVKHNYDFHDSKDSKNNLKFWMKFVCAILVCIQSSFFQFKKINLKKFFRTILLKNNNFSFRVYNNNKFAVSSVYMLNVCIVCAGHEFLNEQFCS